MSLHSQLARVTAITVAAMWSGGVALATPCASTELDKLTSFDAFAQDNFGNAVAVSGNLAVVGVLRDDGQTGSARVWQWTSEGWRDLATLTTSGAEPSAELGVSVAFSGDTIVLGAHFNDANGTDSGAAFVFERPAGGWVDMTETARLTASDGTGWDNFGWAVDIDGTRIVVGANLADPLAVNSGAVYVFDRQGSDWVDSTETAKLVAPDGAFNDEFGRSVAVSGDTILVGAHYASLTAFWTGAAYVFDYDGTDWDAVARLEASDADADDRFGQAVALDGDLAVIGAWHDAEAGTATGAAYVFEGPWTTGTEQAKLTASDATPGDHFGWSVAVQGDKVLVGAPANLFDGTGAGSAYVFEADPGTWTDGTETRLLSSSDGAEGDEFGIDVALDGDHVLVGAMKFDTEGYDQAGAAYAFAAASCSERTFPVVMTGDRCLFMGSSCDPEPWELELYGDGSYREGLPGMVKTTGGDWTYRGGEMTLVEVPGSWVYKGMFSGSCMQGDLGSSPWTGTPDGRFLVCR